MTEQLVAGVDSSTQSCKVVVREARSGCTIRTGRAPHPDGSEVDPAAWWEALGLAIADAGGLDDVAAIAVAGQQHGMVTLDTEAARTRRLAVERHAQRRRGRCPDRELGPDTWVERTGLLPVASITGAKLRWLRDSEPDNVERVAAVVLPHDWLSWRLRGYGPAGDAPWGPTSRPWPPTARTPRVPRRNPDERAYEPELFSRALGRPMEEAGGEGPPEAVVVPRVVDVDQPMGTVAQDVSFPNGTKCRPDWSWGRAPATTPAVARPGSGAGRRGLSIGTSGTVFGAPDAAVTDPAARSPASPTPPEPPADRDHPERRPGPRHHCRSVGDLIG